jgi:hypothetical protein
VYLNNNSALFSGEELNFEIPLEEYRCRIVNQHRRFVDLQQLPDMEPKGELLLSVRMPSYVKTYSGWMLKQAGHKLGFNSKGKFKMRFFIICEGSIMYFDDAHSLSSPRGTILASEVKAMTYGVDEMGIDTLEIESTKDVWYLQWLPDDQEVIRETWLRKFGHCCTHETVVKGFRTKNGDAKDGASYVSLSAVNVGFGNEKRLLISRKASGSMFSLF